MQTKNIGGGDAHQWAGRICVVKIIQDPLFFYRRWEKCTTQSIRKMKKEQAGCIQLRLNTIMRDVLNVAH